MSSIAGGLLVYAFRGYLFYDQTPGVFRCTLPLIRTDFLDDELSVAELGYGNGLLCSKHFSIKERLGIRQHSRELKTGLRLNDFHERLHLAHYSFILTNIVNRGLPHLRAGIPLLSQPGCLRWEEGGLSK